MSDMVDLKRRPTDPEDKRHFKVSGPEAYYPLNLYCDKTEIEKLGLGKANVGDEFLMTAKVRVTSVSAGESDDGHSYASLNLAVTEAALAPMPVEKSQAERLFGAEADGDD